MGSVTALMMDVITEKSGHTMTGLAVSVCLTPAAPSPLPLPYPTVATVSEGVMDECLRTKIDGAKVLTVGSCTKNCHGNEPGTLKEVVSLNTAGPCFPILGAPIVFIELGMAGITLSPGFMNKNPIPGIGGSASGAGGGGGGGGGAGGGAGGPPGGSTQGPSNSGGGGGGSNSGAAPPNAPAPPGADGQATGGHPVDIATGAMFTSPSIDFQLTGPMWVSFVRTYRTSAVRKDVGLGWGWSHSLHFQARRRGDRLTIIDETLREAEIPLPPAGEIAVLPYGRKLWMEGHMLVLDLGDDLLRVLVEQNESGEYVLSQLRDTFGNIADLHHEGGALSEIIDAVGRRAILVKEGRTRSWWLTVADADGKEHRSMLALFELDERGDLVRSVDSGGVDTTYGYDDEHFLIWEQQPDGVRYHFVYSDEGGQRRCVETWGALPGHDILSALGAPEASSPDRPKGIYHTRFEYQDGRTVVTDAFGHRHTYDTNALRLVDRYIDPRGYSSIFRYDMAGQLQSVTDGSGITARMAAGLDGLATSFSIGQRKLFSFRLDDEGRAMLITGPDGRPERSVVSRGKETEYTDGQGRTTKVQYDERGRPVEIVHPNGTTETRSYDAHGNVHEAIGPTGARFQYEFDLLGRPVMIRNPDGLEYKLQYDSRGDLVGVRDSTGRVTATAVDRAHRVVRVDDSRTGTMEMRYVGGALVEKREADGRTYRFGYDANLRLRWIENPAGERYTREYDPAGNIESERFFSGQTKSYTSDGANRLAMLTRGDGQHVRVTRDELGQMIARELPDRTDRFQYDDAGRLVAAKSPDAAITFHYDERGRAVGEAQVCGGWTFSVRYELDAVGLVVAKRYSTGWSVELERRPEDGAPRKIRLGGDAPASLEIEHDAVGREVSRRFDGAALSLATERDIRGMPVAMKLAGAGGEELHRRAFRWSDLGPIEAIEDSANGSRAFVLDRGGRVVRASGFGRVEEYSYTPHGTPIPAERGHARVVAGGRPTATEDAHLEWDARGRLAVVSRAQPARSFRYVYDAADRLVLAIRGDGVQIRYLYDALGRRLAEISSAGESTFFGWEGDAIVEENAPGKLSVRRVFDDDGYVPIAETAPGGAWRIVACDAAGTPWLYAGADGSTAAIELSVWGKPLVKRGDPGSLRFAGQRADAFTGLHYNRHRYYDPDLGLFLTPDPLGVFASVQDIGFVPNVTLFIDPLGLVAIVAGSRSDPVIQGSVRRLQQEYPGARVIYSDQLGQPPSLWQRIRGRNNRLDGEDHVIVTTHGAPGFVEWGRGTATGPQIGDQLNNAGFNGRAPGAKVDLIACNGATPPQGGMMSASVAGGIARTTGAQTSGALSGQLNRTYNNETDPIQGVREVRDWPRFWQRRQVPAVHQYGPGMMSGTPNAPFVHNGSYVTYGPGVW